MDTNPGSDRRPATTRRDAHVLVTFLVTEDGEQGHPMDTIVTRVNLDGDAPSTASMANLLDRVQREVRRKVAARP